MYIVNADVQWGGHYFNQTPQIVVLVNKADDWREVRFIEREGQYLSVPRDGLSLHYNKKIPEAPSQGQGGQVVKVTMIDQSMRILIGPWITGAYHINPLFPEYQCMDTTVYTTEHNTGQGGVVLQVSRARELIDRFLPGIELTYKPHNQHNSIDPGSFYPRRTGGPTKFTELNAVDAEFVKIHPDFNSLKWHSRGKYSRS